MLALFLSLVVLCAHGLEEEEYEVLEAETKWLAETMKELKVSVKK